MNNLQHYREQAGLSQSELARKTGIDQSKISKTEAGGSDLRGQHWRLIAEVLDVSLDKLLGIRKD